MHSLVVLVVLLLVAGVGNPAYLGARRRAVGIDGEVDGDALGDVVDIDLRYPALGHRDVTVADFVGALGHGGQLQREVVEAKADNLVAVPAPVVGLGVLVDDDGLLVELHVVGVALGYPVALALVVAVDAVGGEFGHERSGIEAHAHVEHLVAHIGVEDERAVDVIIDAVVAVEAARIVDEDALDGELTVPTTVDAETFIAGSLPFLNTNDGAWT